MSGADVLVVSVESTTGWVTSARELVSAMRRAGASVELARTAPQRAVPTFALTDLVEARAARRAARRGMEKHAPRSIVYCSITAALLWPRPGAIWLDALAAENRPGRHGVWQRRVEQRRLAEAPLVLAMSPSALGPSAAVARVELLPVPVERSGPPAERDIAALTYAGNPEKKRLAYVLEAWERARREGETLLVAGLDGLAPRPGVEVVGALEASEYRALLRRTQVFVAAPRREDYGAAPLEALADGCRLVTTPAPGAYPAREIARQLDPRLVSDDLAQAIRIALDDPVPDYAAKASELLSPYSHRAFDQTVAQRVLPRLLRS